MKKYIKYISFGFMMWSLLFVISFVIDLFSITTSGVKYTFMGLGIEVIENSDSLETLFWLTPRFIPMMLITLTLVFVTCLGADYFINREKSNDNS